MAGEKLSQWNRTKIFTVEEKLEINNNTKKFYSSNLNKFSLSLQTIFYRFIVWTFSELATFSETYKG